MNWLKILEEDKKRNPYTWCVIDGVHYTIGDENDPSEFRGFGGNKFCIIFNDGTKVITTNLWCQGDIDKEIIHLFPDNATFNYEWKKYPSGTEYLIRKEDEKVS